MKEVLAVVLAGGKGSRLGPLTRDRAKPAVPFGGVYRIIDFTLSNCLNSGLRRILVLTQYKAMSLDRHITLGWRNYLCRELGEFIDVVPPQQRIDEQWYQGTADAVYQNIYTLEKERPEHVVILAGDHIYKMDYGKLVAQHQEKNADLTIAALRVRAKEAARQFGVIQVDDSGRVIGFEEKPAEPKTIPGNPEYCLASMGIYVFNSDVLMRALEADAADPASQHDFGKNIIPSLIPGGRMYAYPFYDENKKAAKYWRDIGTLDAYFEANMDLCQVNPEFNLYDPEWPLRTYMPQAPPAKFVFAEDWRRGEAQDSLISQGCIVSGSRIHGSILCPNVRVHSFCTIEASILMPGVRVGRHARIRRAIIDRDVHIPRGAQIGYDAEEDARRHTVSEGGVVVVAAGEEPLIGPIDDEALKLEAEADRRG